MTRTPTPRHSHTPAGRRRLRIAAGSAPRVIPWLAGSLWAAAVSAGLGVMLNYTSRPGDAGDAPTTWPDDAGWSVEPGSMDLLLFTHPRCPCTDATLAQLQRVMANADRPVRVDVVFWTPEEDGQPWAEGRLWDAAAMLPAAHRHADPGGVITRRFGARTSGHVLLYGPDGRLLFSGGVTAGRGHQGDNPGAAALRAAMHSARHEDGASAAVTAGASAAVFNAVFGCPIQPGGHQSGSHESGGHESGGQAACPPGAPACHY